MRANGQDRRRIGAVIVHFDAPNELEDCLEALHGGSLTPDQTVIVDNSSDLQATTEAGRLAIEFGADLVANDQNVGFAAGCNQGAGKLDGCHQILFINQDAVVTADAVAALSKALTDDRQLGAVNPLILTGDDRVWFAGGALDRRLARLTRRAFGAASEGVAERMSDWRTDWLNGCAMLVRAEAWDRMGGFDERYFLYWEDVELSLRLTRAGWTINVEPTAKVIHHQDRNGDGLRHLSPASVQHSIRSRLLFLRNELTAAEQLTAVPYTLINVLRFVALVIQAHGLRISPFVRAIGAGVRSGVSD